MRSTRSGGVGGRTPLEMCVRDQEFIWILLNRLVVGIPYIIPGIGLLGLTRLIDVLEEMGMHAGIVQQLARFPFQLLLGGIINVVSRVGANGLKTAEINAVVPAQDDLEGLEY